MDVICAHKYDSIGTCLTFDKIFKYFNFFVISRFRKTAATFTTNFNGFVKVSEAIVEETLKTIQTRDVRTVLS